MPLAVSLQNVQFAWPGHHPILSIEKLQIQSGERVFLSSPSGTGKSTLLGLIAGILPLQSGALNVLGSDMTSLSARARDRLRARDVGVIFQMFNLLPFLTVIENVTLGCRFSSDRRARLDGTPQAEARRLLGRLGLSDDMLLARRVSALSVGQQQRVAVARALLGAPKLILADEPTSALDAGMRDRFLQLLLEETARADAALLMVSHDAALAEGFDRTLDLETLNQIRRPMDVS